jgi:predicted enzyme related to lactoylglutathione lyase
VEENMSHPIVHIELSADSPEELAKFYEDTFGWETQRWPEMDYITFSSKKDSIGGGFNPVQDGNPSGTVITYIQTEDLAASMAKVEANGGTITLPPTDIPGVGQMAHFTDPTGNPMALLEPARDES